MGNKKDKDYERLLKLISTNVKRIRKANRLTQEDMIQFGFNYRHYQKLESGVYSFNLYTLQRLARAFKVHVREFFVVV